MCRLRCPARVEWRSLHQTRQDGDQILGCEWLHQEGRAHVHAGTDIIVAGGKHEGYAEAGKSVSDRKHGAVTQPYVEHGRIYGVLSARLIDQP
jgi:hypothetical protein